MYLSVQARHSYSGQSGKQMTITKHEHLPSSYFNLLNIIEKSIEKIF